MPTYQYILTNLNTSETKTLEAFPADWAELTRNYERDLTYHGIFRMYTIQQRFMNIGGESFDKGGYWFIKSAYDSRGTKAKVQVERKVYNPFTAAFDDDLVGMILFNKESGFTIDLTEKFVECTIIESSKIQDFISNDDKNLALDSDIAINGNAITAFSNHPRNILFQPINIYLYAYTNGSINVGQTGITTTIDTSANYNRTVELTYLGDRLFDSGTKIYENTSDESINVTIQLRSSYNITWTFNPLLVGDNNISYNSQIRSVVRDSGGSPIQTFTHFTQSNNQVDITSQTTDNYSSSLNTNNEVDVPAGGYIDFTYDYAITNIRNISANISATVTISSYDIIEFYESPAASNITCWFTHELSQRMIQIMTGETDTSKLLESNIFGRTDSEFQTYVSNGDLAYLVTVGGKVIRGFPEGKTKINFRDWFKSIDYMANIALWYDKTNDRFRIEEKEQVYKNELTLDFGVVKDVKITPAKHASQLLTGTREKGVYEKLQGVQEFNIQTEHSADFPEKSKIDIRVPYNIDSVAMEFARREDYRTNGLTDTKQDDKTFIVETDGTKTLRFDEITGGVNEDSFIGIEERYNGNYTPRRCLLNNGNWIFGIFEKEIAKPEYIKFENNSKDIDIAYGSPEVNEQDSISATDLVVPLYYHDVFEFEFAITYQQIQQIETDPHGYYRIETEDGDEYYLYPLSIEVNDYKGLGNGKFIRANLTGR